MTSKTMARRRDIDVGDTVELLPEGGRTPTHLQVKAIMFATTLNERRSDGMTSFRPFPLPSVWR